MRNPDVVCIEKLEHFLREGQINGLTVLLAGLRPELQAALANLKFFEWYPAERFFPEEDARYSATLRAVRYAYSLIDDANTCAHCAQHGVELMRGSPGQRRQVTPGQTTPGSGDVAHDAHRDLIICE